MCTSRPSSLKDRYEIMLDFPPYPVEADLELGLTRINNITRKGWDCRSRGGVNISATINIEEE